MNEAKHIGWLETEPRCKVWECEDTQLGYDRLTAECGQGWRTGLFPAKRRVLSEVRSFYVLAPRPAADIRKWPEFTPVDDGPTGEIADELRSEGCVWAGVLQKQPNGHRPDYWEHKKASTFSAGTRVRGAYHALENREQEDQRVESIQHWVVLPKVVVSLRSRGLLTRDEPDKLVNTRVWTGGSGYGTESGEGWWVCACGGTNDPMNSTCECCGVSGKPGGEPVSPPLRRMVDVRREVWGEMTVERPKVGKVLNCSDTGHVRLRLDLLSDDREKAVGQIEEACEEALVNREANRLGMRMHSLICRLRDLRGAIEAGWKLEPRLQAVRDAHAAFEMELAWQEGNVSDVVDRETLTTGNDPGPPVAEAGAPKPGWGK